MKALFSRAWVMPNRDTFQMAPVRDLLDRHLVGRVSVADPFARTSRRATWSNDLDPSFGHTFSLEASDFCRELERAGVILDGALFDPPYSPRQISDCYKSVGLKVGREETQSARLYSAVRDLLSARCAVGAVGISFGWNSSGFGLKRGWELVEVLLLCHGGAHNDTICVVERKVAS